MRWSFRVKRLMVDGAMARMKKQWKSIHQRITMGSQGAARGFGCSKEQLYASGPRRARVELENEICCITSRYWNPHFSQNVEDQGQTESRSGGTRASHKWGSYHPHIGVTKIWAGICGASGGGYTVSHSWRPLLSSVQFQEVYYPPLWLGSSVPWVLLRPGHCL